MVYQNMSDPSKALREISGDKYVSMHILDGLDDEGQDVKKNKKKKKKKVEL